ncbi:hypothetical protein [Actinophytocola sp.]|uniref:hypothetical protein n=1 Tax=Actinophytocola sp. TaxID=1872138 RepID=UPI003D6C69BA
MAQPENHDRHQKPASRRGVQAVGLRIAALTGVVLSAGAIAAAAGSDAGAPVDDPIDTVVSGTGWPLGSTCCPEESD